MSMKMDLPKVVASLSPALLAAAPALASVDVRLHALFYYIIMHYYTILY